MNICSHRGVVAEYLGFDEDPPPPEGKTPSSSPLAGRTRKGNPKTAEAVFCECDSMVEECGVKRVVFMTITFTKRIKTMEEAQKAWKYFRDKFLSGRIDRGIFVFERHKSGAIHIHGLAAPSFMTDMQGDFDHEALEQSRREKGARKFMLTKRYGDSATPDLRSWWVAFGDLVDRFGIGRTESTPLKNQKGAARYVAKYVNKARDPKDKSVRLVRFINFRNEDGTSSRTRLSSGWSWFGTVVNGVVKVNKGAAINRQKFRWAASKLGFESLDIVVTVLGSNWGYVLGIVGKLMPLAALPCDLRRHEEVARSRAAVRTAELIHDAKVALGEFAFLFDFNLNGGPTPFAKCTVRDTK